MFITRPPEPKDDDENFLAGFHGIPTARELRKMSALRVAELMSHQAPGTPARIALEHEFALRLVSRQNWAVIAAAFIGLFGGFGAAVLAAMLAPYFSR